MFCFVLFFLLKCSHSKVSCEGMLIKWCCYCEELYLFYSIVVLIHLHQSQPSVYLFFFSLTMGKISLQPSQVETRAFIHLVELTYLERYSMG